MWRTTSWLAVPALIVAATLVGCVKQYDAELAPDAAPPERTALAGIDKSQVRFAAAGETDGNTSGPPDGAAAGEGVASTATGLNRKIIYNAQVELRVEDFAGVPEQVIALVKKYDAYVASSSLTGSTGENRRGSWTVRVPVARFEEFIDATKGLGELVNVGTTSRDVSEEFYDVEARIRNKTKEEERLLELLEERPGELKDVIAIERELSRVREELERMQARKRVLTDLTALTTVEVSIVEIRDYRPTQAPTLATRLRRAFEGSMDGLKSAAEGLLIAVVAMAPWLPIVGVVVSPVFFAVRRAHRQRSADRKSRGRA